MISSVEMARFNNLRRKVLNIIERCVKEGSGTKDSEGVFELSFPAYYETGGYAGLESNQPGCFSVSLTLYVFGPHRSYIWRGDSLWQALEAAEADIDKWIAEWFED